MEKLKTYKELIENSKEKDTPEDHKKFKELLDDKVLHD